MIEINLRFFAEGLEFLYSFINVFDSSVVFISFAMNILSVAAKVLGILRVLRLVKVIIEMKKKSDAKRARKEKIKEEKRK